MELMRAGPRGQEIPIVRLNGRHYDVRPLTGDFNAEFWAHGMNTLTHAQVTECEEINIDARRIGAPRSPAGRDHLHRHQLRRPRCRSEPPHTNPPRGLPQNPQHGRRPLR